MCVLKGFHCVPAAQRNGSCAAPPNSAGDLPVWKDRAQATSCACHMHQEKHKGLKDVCHLLI